MRKGKDKGCCKLSKVLLFPVALIMLIALALDSYAIFQCNVSAAPTTFQQGTQINITFNDQLPLTATNYYAEIYIRSTATANSTLVLLANVSNTTGGRWINFTIGAIDTHIVEDAATYDIRANVWNGTVNSQPNFIVNFTGCANNVTNRVFDRTIPDTPTSPAPTGRQTVRDATFMGVVNGSETTECRLVFDGKNPGSSSYVMTHSGNNCSQAFTNLPRGIMSYYIIADDGTNATQTATQTMDIDIRTTAAKKAYIISGGQLPAQASATAQQRAKGQQAESALDRAIAKAPPEAQAGLTKAKEAVTAQYKGFEAVKTWTSTGVGCIAGFAGLTLGPLGLVTIPVGCLGGHLLGMII